MSSFWNSYIESIAKSTVMKVGFLEYCCHFWAGAPVVYLHLLDRIQKHVYSTLSA